MPALVSPVSNIVVIDYDDDIENDGIFVMSIDKEITIVMNVDDYYHNNPKSVWRSLWTEYSSHYRP